MNASMGLRTQARSAAVVDFGTSGCDRLTKAQWRRSTGVYVPSGAIDSDAINSENTKIPTPNGFKRTQHSLPILFYISRNRSQRADAIGPQEGSCPALWQAVNR